MCLTVPGNTGILGLLGFGFRVPGFGILGLGVRALGCRVEGLGINGVRVCGKKVVRSWVSRGLGLVQVCGIVGFRVLGFRAWATIIGSPNGGLEGRP